MVYMTVREADENRNNTERWVQKFFKENRMIGVVRFSRGWRIPKGAVKSIYGRRKDGKPR